MNYLKLVHWVAVALLFFLGVSGVIGAIPMIADPHGSPWQLHQSLLRYSPFHSYLIPGIILLCANGVLPLIVCDMALLSARGNEALIAVQGCVLVGWIVVECVMIRVVAWPHYVYAAVGLAILACGAVLWTATRHQQRRIGVFMR